MDNLSITSYNIDQAWTGTAQICLDQSAYNTLGIHIVFVIGFAFLVGWFLGYYFNELGRKEKQNGS
tara:strand:- start:2868 stop:3065 length:198 start_codon:yes stop_codon:yes gene_type:complete